MKATLMSALLVAVLLSLSRSHTEAKPDLFWFEEYGNIGWADEKARLDGVARVLLGDPNEVAYIYVRAGRLSCKGEAQARALRAKNYLAKVRHADENRIAWVDVGFGDEFQVSIGLAPAWGTRMEIPYQSATEQHVIKDCGSDPMKFNRHVKPARA